MRLLHLVGSAVDERTADLSRLYARGCLDVLGATGRYEAEIAYVSPGGVWSFPHGLDAAARASADRLTAAEAVSRIGALEVEAVVPQMFDTPGMTSYRSLFEVLGLPLIGNTGDVMALATDKQRTRAVVAASGVAVPDGELLRGDDEASLAPPTVVKPAGGDNSDGVSLVLEPAQYADALRAARGFGDRTLVERYVPLGREVRCGVLETDGRLRCLPLEEYRVDPVGKPIRGGDDKLAATGDDLHLVAKDDAHAWIVDADDPIVPAVHEAARLAHVALGCRQYSLFDFRIDPQGRPWFLEAGLYCSFSPQSVVVVMAAAAGIPVEDLFDQVLAEALGRRTAAA